MTLTFCMCMGHDHSSHGNEGQSQRSMSEVKVRLGSQFETRSVGLRSSIEDSFLVRFAVVQNESSRWCRT